GLGPQASEQPGARLLEDLELGVGLVDPELVEGRVLGLLDGAPRHLHPLHRSPAPTPLFRPPARLGLRSRPLAATPLARAPGPLGRAAAVATRAAAVATRAAAVVTPRRSCLR